ncbi:STAS domain-containing protein [Candidatus Aerophobetes bacterium]|nr:STAS domain-containing protein [Candidatus Aerophobetes bacterium]
MIEFNMEDKYLVCSFPERLDTNYCAENSDELLQKIEESGREVIFDLQKTAYISSAFLRICLQISKEKGRECFSLTNVCPSVKKVFKIAGFDKLMNIR